MFLCVLVQCASGYTISISCLGRVASSPFGGDAARRGCDFKKKIRPHAFLNRLFFAFVVSLNRKLLGFKQKSLVTGL